MLPLAQPVIIQYSSLVDPSPAIHTDIEKVRPAHLPTCSDGWPYGCRKLCLTLHLLQWQAFGDSGLGLVVVEGVPGYAEARRRLLPLAQQLAVRRRTRPGGGQFSCLHAATWLKTNCGNNNRTTYFYSICCRTCPQPCCRACRTRHPSTTWGGATARRG